MLLDARSIADGSVVDADLCIVGAGPAGITIAREFGDRGVRVALLESGGEQIDRRASALLRGQSVGYPAYLTRSRGRAFGGTSRRWLPKTGLRARPLDPEDFEARPWVPHSGWPFGRAELDPYYERAQRACKLGPFDYRLERWADSERGAPLSLAGGEVETKMFQFGPHDVFASYREELSRLGNVMVALHANVVEIETLDAPELVSGVRVATHGGNQFTLRARLYVLATGAIENARLLLASNGSRPAGLGNEHDVVGRYYTEHPSINSGRFRPADPAFFERMDLYRQRHMVEGVPVQGTLSLTPEALRRERILNATFWILPATEAQASDGVASARALVSAIPRRPLFKGIPRHLLNVARDAGVVASFGYRSLRRAHPAPRLAELRVMSEQAPRPDSRVTLGTDRDAFGMPRVRLDWKVGDFERRSIRRAQEIIDSRLRASGIGALEAMLGDEQPAGTLTGNAHDLGTTRMHADAKHGVVDPDCRVHSVANLYVAGSSVFPTGGYANPTLTNVALAIRLADHLRGVLGGRS